MIPITPFNLWILKKINSYLEIREGCKVVSTNYTLDGAKTIMQDTFGFQYEVHVKTTGRCQNDSKEMDKYLKDLVTNK